MRRKENEKKIWWKCLAHQKSTHCEKRVVPDGQSDETSNMKDPLYFVTHKMYRKRAKEKERPKTCSIFSHLNTFQLLFNLDSDILSFSLTWPLIQVSFHITWKTIHKNAIKHYRTLWNSHKYSKSTVKHRKYGDEMVTEQKLKLLLAVNLYRVS
jgi:hypothetical protein